MSEMMMIPWYATGFRSDQFAEDLNEVAAAAMHYGATSYVVYRSKDDRYKFQQYVTFENHLDWERYWDGPHMVEFRSTHSSWYQIPVLYSPWEQTAAGQLGEPIPHVTPAAVSDAVQAEATPNGGHVTAV